MKRKVGETSLCNHRHGWVRGPLIGKGGFGSVYLACSITKPYPPVMAVKSVDFFRSIELLKEKWFLKSLRGCPNVIQCFGDDITKTDSGHLIFNLLLEYASGGTLDDLIKKSNNGHGLPELTVRRYTKSILEGLKDVHESNIVHCDLKPENILLVPSATSCATGTEFIPKISDFGLSKRMKRSHDNHLRGTPLYLSPEVVVNQIQEQPSDVWALGCVVLKMLTGKPPWDMKGSIEDLLSRIASTHYSPVIPSDISEEGKDFLRCCFVRNPQDRLTAAKLLNHPFISELDGLCQVSTDVSKADKETSRLCSEEADDFIPLGDSPSTSLEQPEVSCEASFDIIPRAIMHSSCFKPALPRTTWQRPYGFAVPARV